MWDDPDKRLEKKIFKIARNAAYALGGALGCWFVKLLYPEPEKAQNIVNVLEEVAWVLLAYGASMMLVILAKKRLAPFVNFLFIGFVIPTCVLYIFANNWPN